MAKISINLSVTRTQIFSKEEEIVLLKKDTVVSYETALEILERLGELEKMVEVIRISFEQSSFSAVKIKFVVVLSGFFLRSKIECSKDYIFVTKDPGKEVERNWFSGSIIARKIVDYIVRPRIEELVKEAEKEISIVSKAVEWI